MDEFPEDYECEGQIDIWEWMEEKESQNMTIEEAKEIFLNRGYIQVKGGRIYDGDKWRESVVVISKWLEQQPTTKENLVVGDCISREFIEIVVDYPPADLCTYPEYRGKPYFSIKYRENGKGYVGFGTYKIEMLSQWIKEYFMPSIQPKAKAEWIPVSEGLPEVGQTVRVIDDRGKVFEYELNPLDVDKYTTGKWRFLDHEIIAWQPLQNHTR